MSTQFYELSWNLCPTKALSSSRNNTIIDRFQCKCRKLAQQVSYKTFIFRIIFEVLEIL